MNEFFTISVNGNYSNWSSWSDCSVSCGEGIRLRNRICDNPEPAYGGNGCEDYGSDEMVTSCIGQGKCTPGKVTMF